MTNQNQKTTQTRQARKYDPHARHDAEYARWAANENAKKRDRETDSTLEQYAMSIVDGPAFSQQGIRVGETTYSQPAVALVSGGNTIACGIPASIGCCDHTRPAKDFLVSGGKVVGLCGKAGFIFRQARKGFMESGDRRGNLNRLRTHQFQAQAEMVLAHNLGEHREELFKECPICNRPNRGSRR